MSKEYTNGEVTVRWKADLCIHSANCVNNLPSVFKPKEKPWVQVEGASTAAIVETLKKCPSGALTYYMNNEKEKNMEDKSTATHIKIRKGGSTLITGKVIIEHADGTTEEKTKCALCRCGGSGNMPFCDGSHNGLNFEAD